MTTTVEQRANGSHYPMTDELQKGITDLLQNSIGEQPEQIRFVHSEQKIRIVATGLFRFLSDGHFTEESEFQSYRLLQQKILRTSEPEFRVQLASWFRSEIESIQWNCNFTHKELEIILVLSTKRRTL